SFQIIWRVRQRKRRGGRRASGTRRFGAAACSACSCGRTTEMLLCAPGNGWRLTIMKRFLLTAALLAGFGAAPALAQVTKVGDWTIEKRQQDDHCNASRAYKDKDDDNREYTIVLTYSDKAIVFVIVYDGWEWEKTGQVLHADFSTDDDDIMKASKWEVMD